MKLHLANTDFEFELGTQRQISLEKSLAMGSLTQQLQFIPILYADSGDFIFTYGLPEKNYEEHLLDLGIWHRDSLPKFLQTLPSDFSGEVDIVSWGASKRIKEWACQRGIEYRTPPWDVVREVNSKAFTFEHCQPLPGASLLKNEREVDAWIQLGSQRKVLKTCFGLSSQGHFMIDHEIDRNHLKVFLQREFSKNLPVIGEPWVERLMDFSTQWKIQEDGSIECVGTIGIINSLSGKYLGTIAGDEEKVLGPFCPWLEAHKQAGEKLLQVAAAKGYSGFAGIDAMIYRSHEGHEMLHPVVELNARMTMGLAALLFQKRYFPSHFLSLHYRDKRELTPSQLAHSLLPEALWIRGAKKFFPKQLCYEIH